MNNFKIRMKHTTDSAYNSNQFDNGDDWTVVYSGNETITQTGWHHFPLQTPFDYDGERWLLIDFSHVNTTSNSQHGFVYTTNTSAYPNSYRLLAGASDTDDPFDFVNPNYSFRFLFNLILKVQPDTDVLASDFNYNCSVGMEDLLTMINAWLTQPGDTGQGNIIGNNRVDLADFSVLGGEWLDSMYTTPPTVALIADFDGNGSVGTEDLTTLSLTWLAQDGDVEYNSHCDISLIMDNTINFEDYVVFASQWMDQIP